jgi:hypothetical protein
MTPSHPTPESTSQTGTTATPPRVQLNVILHGLWGIENNPDKIRAVSVEVPNHIPVAPDHLPEAPDHVIRVGDFNDMVDLNVPSHYALEGVDGASVQRFDAEQNLVVVDERVTDLTKVVAIDFPRPNEIKSIRRFETHDKKFFDGADAPKTPKEIAMVQVLIYEKVDPRALRLPPLDTFAFPEPNNEGAINLHLFAEPPDEVVAKKIEEHEEAHPKDKPHFKVAFETLARAFGLQITPLKTGKANMDNGGVPGLTPEDTVGLHERPRRGSANLAVSPINCEMLVAENTDPTEP